MTTSSDSDDPTVSNPDHYSTLWENEFVRVLEYRDTPGTETTPHHHPNSVMVTLSDFERRLRLGDQHRDVKLSAGQAVWLPEQRHAGTNTGSTPTHTILIELKSSSTGIDTHAASLGPKL
ncbi:MAG: cytoplasmic protein [Microbacteriaceae bacterium]|nr:cytoplasmic protein [Microbacteriaceae bacterium]